MKYLLYVFIIVFLSYEECLHYQYVIISNNNNMDDEDEVVGWHHQLDGHEFE